MYSLQEGGVETPGTLPGTWEAISISKARPDSADRCSSTCASARETNAPPSARLCAWAGALTAHGLPAPRPRLTVRAAVAGRRLGSCAYGVGAL
eukprot:6186898-Pleurochrysis_carterae.AAC.1